MRRDYGLSQNTGTCCLYTETNRPVRVKPPPHLNTHTVNSYIWAATSATLTLMRLTAGGVFGAAIYGWEDLKGEYVVDINYTESREM